MYICILYIYCMNVICILYLYYMYIINVLLEYYMYIMCILHVYYMYIIGICMLYVHYHGKNLGTDGTTTLCKGRSTRNGLFSVGQTCSKLFLLVYQRVPCKEGAKYSTCFHHSRQESRQLYYTLDPGLPSLSTSASWKINVFPG